MRTYSELITIPTFEDRFHYLKLDGTVGLDTFGFDRYLNQKFYRSTEWKRIRDFVITRDLGRDMAFEDREIYGRIYIHHMNPITAKDIHHSEDCLFDPENLICVSFDTHNAIHYGTYELIKTDVLIERKPGDTCPWK